jgi:hypothetical protein
VSDQNPQQAGMERMQARYKGKEPPLLCPAGFPVAPGTKEWVVEKGEQGAKGDKGERGERGMPAGQRRAIIYLFVVPILIAAAALFGLIHYARQLSREQREIIQVANTNSRQRCGSIAQIVVIPIPEPTAGNPSREWEARYEQIERQRGVQLGCRLPRAQFASSKPGAKP